MTEQPDSTASAIFVDGDWLNQAARRLEEVIDYGRLKESLNDCFGAEAPTHFFCSVDAERREQREFVQKLRSLNYIVHVSELRRLVDRSGNMILVSKGLEVALAVSAMALPDRFRTIVLLSGDSDFLPLVETAKALGREVILITVPPAARALVEAAGKNFINLESLLKNLKEGEGIPPIRRKKAIPPRSMYVEKGDNFAPYIVLREIFRSAKAQIVMVDPYVDEQVLQMIPLLAKRVRIAILSKRISPSDFCVQVRKLRRDGYTVHVYRTNAFHDRFLGVDGQWWHSGHSFKDLGGGDSYISRVGDPQALAKLGERVHSEMSKGKEYCT